MNTTIQNIAKTGAAVALLALVGAGCMLSPTDDRTVESRSERLTFSGYDLEPGRRIRVQGYHPKRREWQLIGQTWGAQTPSTFAAWDEELYNWRFGNIIPHTHWERGARGYKARLRPQVEVNGSWRAMTTVEADWASCISGTESAVDFNKKCKSDKETESVIYTEDYCTAVPNQRSQTFIFQHWIGKELESASFEFTITADVPGKRVKSFDVDYPSNRLGFEPRCQLYPKDSEAILLCECTTRNGQRCGDFMKKSCEKVLETPQRVNVTMNIDDPSVPTGCALAEKSFTLTADLCDVFREEAPEEPPAPPPPPRGYRAVQFSNCHADTERDMVLWVYDANTGRRLSSDTLSSQGASCLPGQKVIELDEGEQYYFVATWDIPGCSGEGMSQPTACTPFESSSAVLGDEDGLVHTVNVN